MNKLSSFYAATVAFTCFCAGAVYSEYQVESKLNQAEQVACILNDICHQAMDNEIYGTEFTEEYYSWVENLDAYGVSITPEIIEQYSWCY